MLPDIPYHPICTSLCSLVTNDGIHCPAPWRDKAEERSTETLSFTMELGKRHNVRQRFEPEALESDGTLVVNFTPEYMETAFQEFLRDVGTDNLEVNLRVLGNFALVINNEYYDMLEDRHFEALRACFGAKDNRVTEAAVCAVAAALEQTDRAGDLIARNFDLILFEHLYSPRAADGIGVIVQLEPGIWEKFKAAGCMEKVLELHKRWNSDGKLCANVDRVLCMAVEGGVFQSPSEMEELGRLVVTIAARISKATELYRSDVVWIDAMYDVLMAVRDESILARLFDTDFFVQRLRNVTLDASQLRIRTFELVLHMASNSKMLFEMLVQKTEVLRALQAAVYYSATHAGRFVEKVSVIGDLLCLLLQESDDVRNAVLTPGVYRFREFLGYDSGIEVKVVAMRVAASLLPLWSSPAVRDFILGLKLEERLIDMVAVDDDNAVIASLRLMHAILEMPELPENFSCLLTDEASAVLEGAMESENQEISDLARLVHDAAAARISSESM